MSATPTTASGEAGWVWSDCPRCRTTANSRCVELGQSNGSPDVWIVRCESCGLRRLDPQPRGSTLNSYYEGGYNAYEGRVRGGLKQAVWDILRDIAARRRPWPRLLAPIAKTLSAGAARPFDVNVALDPARRPRAVIDVGCGFGDLLIYLRDRGVEVVGVDVSQRAATAASRYGVHVHVGDVMKLELPARRFDAAIMCHSLEHVEDPVGTVAAVVRTLQPDATFHIAVPNGASVALPLEGRAWLGTSFPIHLWFFAREDLTGLLDAVGLDVEAVRYGMNWGAHLELWRRWGCRGILSATKITLLSILLPCRRDVLRVVARKRQ